MRYSKKESSIRIKVEGIVLSEHIEVELKLTCTDRRIWKKIMTTPLLTEIAVPESRACKTLEAHYFDTPTGCLQKAKLAYRIRCEGEEWVATVKGGGSSSGGLHEREEWNIVVNDPRPDLSIFSGTDVGKKLTEVVGHEPLIPILVTRFERTSFNVIMPDGSQIEVAADQGTIIAGSQIAPILEVELELKAGQAAAVIQLGGMLAREYPLLPENDSKFYRGLKLAGLATAESPQVLKKIQVEKQVKTGEGLRTTLVRLILQVFLAQQLFLANQTQPERVHELCSSLHRLRSFLEFSKGLFVVEQYQLYQSELRSLGQGLEVVRDLDVAYAQYKQCCENLLDEEKSSLGQVLTKLRLREATKIHKDLQKGLASPLLLDLWGALAEKPIQKFSEEHLMLEQYAAKELALWVKMITKQGKSIDWTSVQTVHDILWQVKKLRYTVKILQPVLWDISQLILRLDTLQEKLELLTAYETTDTLLKNLLTKKATQALHLPIGMIMGWHERDKQLIQRKLEKHWKKVYRIVQRREWNRL